MHFAAVNTPVANDKWFEELLASWRNPSAIQISIKYLASLLCAPQLDAGLAKAMVAHAKRNAGAPEGVCATVPAPIAKCDGDD
jgi:hypothetical protein